MVNCNRFRTNQELRAEQLYLDFLSIMTFLHQTIQGKTFFHSNKVSLRCDQYWRKEKMLKSTTNTSLIRVGNFQMRFLKNGKKMRYDYSALSPRYIKGNSVCIFVPPPCLNRWMDLHHIQHASSLNRSKGLDGAQFSKKGGSLIFF